MTTTDINQKQAVLSILVKHLGEKKAAARIEKAVAEVLSEGKAKTPDIGGFSKTEHVGLAVEKKLIG
jgi:isocitrate/isopropylmalate dehydrogenase